MCCWYRADGRNEVEKFKVARNRGPGKEVCAESS